MTDLLLEIESVVNMDLERAAAVGRAFDEDPELRPLRVGGDPARLSVESTLGNLIRQTGLPIDWLTVRSNSRRDRLDASLGAPAAPHDRDGSARVHPPRADLRGRDGRGACLGRGDAGLRAACNDGAVAMARRYELAAVSAVVVLMGVKPLA
jgi:hypothetical protein